MSAFTCKTKVIVLKRTSFQESDLIVRTLDQKGGSLSFLAKGAAKSQKRFTGGVLEPGHFIGIEYKASKRSSLHQLKQAWFIKRFEHLRKSYEHLKLALYFLEIIERISQEGVDDCPELFNLLGNSLQAIENSHHLEALKSIFEFRLLWNQGILPTELHYIQADWLGITVSEHHQLVQQRQVLKKVAPAIHSAVEHYINKKYI